LKRLPAARPCVHPSACLVKCDEASKPKTEFLAACCRSLQRG
jgi:hypothetical protein